MKYTENDEIELGLAEWGFEYFQLVWRFKKCRKFLFFKFHDKWHRLKIYLPDQYSKGDNPDRTLLWDDVCFNLTDQEDVNQYEALKNKVITKKDLWGYYNIDIRDDLYNKHKQEYLSRQLFLKENVKKLVIK